MSDTMENGAEVADATAEAAPTGEATQEAEPQPLYVEVQSLPWPLAAVGVGATAAAIARCSVLLPPPMRLGALLVMSGGAGALTGEYLVPMTTRVFPDELHVVFGRKNRFRVPLKNVVRAYPRTYRPLIEYGGWGIRLSPHGRAFTMRGKRGVQLILKSGTRLLVGSEDPEALAEVICRAAGCDASPELKEEGETVT